MADTAAATKEPLPPTNAGVTSSESKEEVGQRLETLVDTYGQNDDIHAHESILAPGSQTTSANEGEPHKESSWFRKIADKMGAIVTKDAAYYQYGNNVYNPATGQTNFEFMPIYARIGMHALFCGSAQERVLEDGYLKSLFETQSVKSGKHFDDPASVASIPGFVKEYSLPLDELAIPDLKTGYKNFNDFFARKLRAGARPAADPEDPRVVVSPADCRAVVFEKLSEGQKIWIKGDKFSIPQLLQNSVPNLDDYTEAAIGIFRLAPQDYHRWHSPVTGTVVTAPVDIPGGLFTVNPMAVRSTLDVLTSNKRSVITILTPFSRTPVIVIAVGALLVGSIAWTMDTSPGAQITKGEEMGYFSYGGSTVIVVWPRDMGFAPDPAIADKSAQAVETLVKVGTKVGVIGGLTTV